VAMLELNDAFNRTSGGEGPARAALALILDTSDGALGYPVQGAGRIITDVKIGQSSHAFATAELGFVTVVGILEFSRGEISEFVQFDFPGVVACIVLFNEVVVRLEDFEFVEKFFWGIGFAVFRHPVDESALIISCANCSN